MTRKTEKYASVLFFFFLVFGFQFFFDLTLPDLTFFKGILALDMRILRIVSPSD